MILVTGLQVTFPRALPITHKYNIGQSQKFYPCYKVANPSDDDLGASQEACPYSSLTEQGNFLRNFRYFQFFLMIFIEFDGIFLRIFC